MPDYRPLDEVLGRAIMRAAEGKGRERHANGRDFKNQPIFDIQRAVGSGFTLGQAMKKIGESKKLDHEDRVNELLDAIVYIAAAIIFIDDNHKAD